MKSLKTRRIAFLLLIAFLTNAMLPTANARASDRFATYSATLSETRDGDLCVFIMVSASGKMQKLGASV